jgi:uncharacterized protein (DUF2164 family)
MIPFIVGGVALAATGYGLAKLLEDERSCDKATKPFFVDLDDENNETQENEVLEKYDLVKIELCNTTLMELETALKEIQNLPQEVRIPEKLAFTQALYSLKHISQELEQCFEQYTQTLQDAKKYIDSKLDTLDSIIISSNNFEEYTDEDKKLIYELIGLVKLIEHVVLAQMTSDGVLISRETKRAFGRLEQLVD